MLAEIHYTMSNEIMTLMIAQGVVLAGMIIKFFVDRSNRVQDRLDRIAQAQITREELALRGKEREKRILDKIEENTDINSKALDAANGHNAKIVQVVEDNKATYRVRKS